MFKPEVDQDGNRLRLNELRNEQMIDELFDNYEEYIETSDDIVNIRYGLSSFSMENMKTHLLLFDGTSDITLNSSRKFKLLTYEDKYNSNVNLSIFPFNLSRKVRPVKGVNNLDEYLRDQVYTYSTYLANIINSNEKTLIFTWMNFKSSNEEINDSLDNKIGNMASSVSLNPVFDLPSLVRETLIELGVDSSKFSIEYYGSGMDKATNKYREYDAVVLFGRYQVPGSVISDFNISYSSSITGVDYYVNRVIQAICRTRIRNHKSEPINVYMSSDWSSEVINGVKDYLGISSVSGLNLTKDEKEEVEFMRQNLRSKGITPKKAEQIAKLSILDKGIYEAIMNNMIYETSVTLEEIYSAIPMSRKVVSEYKNVIRSLSKNGVSLKIS